MNSGKRVMSDTRHKFKGLHCLCPLLQTTDKELPFTEAKILLKDSGEYIGEYVAECPNGRCEYLGRLPVFQDKEPLFNNEMGKNSFSRTKVWHSGEDSCSERYVVSQKSETYMLSIYRGGEY